MPLYGFTEKDHDRISAVVKRIEGRPLDNNYIPKRHQKRSAGGGTTISWAKVTGVTDANNYTVSIYDRSDESTAIESGKQMRVFDIVDSLAVGDWVPVQTSNISGEDYECMQQMGAVG